MTVHFSLATTTILKEMYLAFYCDCPGSEDLGKPAVGFASCFLLANFQRPRYKAYFSHTRRSPRMQLQMHRTL